MGPLLLDKINVEVNKVVRKSKASSGSLEQARRDDLPLDGERSEDD